MRWLKRTLVVMGALAILIFAAAQFTNRQEQPVSRMTAGDSEVLIFGRFDSLANAPVDGGVDVTLNGRHRVVLANRDLVVNDILHGKDFSLAEIRLEQDGSLQTIVHRKME